MRLWFCPRCTRPQTDNTNQDRLLTQRFRRAARPPLFFRSSLHPPKQKLAIPNLKFQIAACNSPPARTIRYSQTHSPRPSSPAPSASPRRCFPTSYPPFSDFRKCRNCAEIEASPKRVSARSSPSVNHVSHSAAASITSRITSRCERNRRASYSPRRTATDACTASGNSPAPSSPLRFAPPAPFGCTPIRRP